MKHIQNKKKTSVNPKRKMQLQEKQAKNIENQLSLCSKRMWCRKKKKGRKSAENFPLS